MIIIIIISIINQICNVLLSSSITTTIPYIITTFSNETGVWAVGGGGRRLGRFPSSVGHQGGGGGSNREDNTPPC